MNASTGRRWGVGRLALALISLMVSGSLFAAKTTVILVEGEDDSAVDRFNIQDAIDSAPEKSIIHLKGVFQLDGKSLEIRNPRLKIIGVESPGRDMPLIKGMTDGSGVPLGDTVTNLGNRGFTVLAEKVSIKNIELVDLNRAVSVSTIDGGPSESKFCDDIEILEDTVSDVSIKNLVISNSIRGIQVFGGVQNVEVKNNFIFDTYLDGVILRSGTIACCLKNGPSCEEQFKNPSDLAGSYVIGNMEDVKVTNNHAATQSSALVAWPSSFYASGPSTNVLVKGNTFDGGLATAALFGEVEDFVLSNNLIANGGSQGLTDFAFGGVLLGYAIFNQNASGYTLINNTYVSNNTNFPWGSPSGESKRRDVWLQPTASNNTVTEAEGTIVLDQGSANTVTLKPAD